MSARAIEFYSGIGGLALALSKSQVQADVVQAFDWDQTACKVYSANHPSPISRVDISTLTAEALRPLKASIWLLSPACQPYTVLNPNAKGSQDPRAQSFLHLVQNVLPELAATQEHPERLLVENVAGFESSSTRQILTSSLHTLGYHTLELLLTPLQFGIPNSRLRYYLIAKKTTIPFHLANPTQDGVWRNIPGKGNPWSDSRETNTAATTSRPSLRRYLDPDDSGERFPIPDKVLTKWGKLFDIVKPSSSRTCCFTRGYTQLVERAGSVLQEAEEFDTITTFNEFAAAQARGDEDALSILRPLQLRYFSPSELLRLFAFDQVPESETASPMAERFKLVWPEMVSNKSKYRLIGNSVNVKVVEELIRYLFNDSPT